MKTRVMQRAVWAGLLMGATVIASAVPVTFQVNLGAQTALGKFNPATDTVRASGGFNSWATDFILTGSEANPNIYWGIFNVSGTSGSSIQYKYIMSTASGLTWEGNVQSGNPNGNRTFVLASTNQTLPAVYFNNVTNSTSVTTPVTFQVNMSVQSALGNFDPASGTVSVGGDFNSWSPTAFALTNQVSDTNLWAGTFNLSGAVNSTFNYKIVMNGSVWENNGVGPGGAQNRAVTLSNASPVNLVMYFNNQTNPPPPIPITFQVNLAVQTALGNFDPANGDTVEARGTFNTWAAGFILTNSPASSTIYTGTWVDSSDGLGASVQYQYVLNGATWETLVGNRAHVLGSTNLQTVPLVFFNDVSGLGPLAIGPMTNGLTTLSWTANPNVRLQSATNPASSTWQDVSDTAGQDSATLPVGPANTFFRLKAP
jgi:hypothetical protein